MATLTYLIDQITKIVQDSAYTSEDITNKINEAVTEIAGGITMPNGMVSPPLPELYAYDDIVTTTLAYASLPVNYQRNVFRVVDDSGEQIQPPIGGDYYAFQKFMRQITDLRLIESGEIYRVAVKGKNLYYQGIPSTATTLWIHYYRIPTPLQLEGDEVDGIPSHLQVRLIKHWVCKEIFGEAIEDGQDSLGASTKYHTSKFFEAMNDLINFIGIDEEPMYYGSGDFEDRGIVD